MSKKNNNYKVISAIGYLGYSIGTAQIALLTTFIATILINYTVLLTDTAPDPVYRFESALTEPYFTSTVEAELPIEQKVFLIALLVAISLFAVFFVGKHSSNILKRILLRFTKKQTLSTLFIAKTLSITTNFLLISLALLALPTFYELLPVIAVGSITAMACFLIQHTAAKRQKIPYKKVV